MACKKSKKNYIFGSVSSGTMRPEHLIPSFLSVASDLKIRNKKLSRIRRTLNHSEKYREKYFSSEDSSFDLDFLFDLLNEYSPPYFFFGAHPGNGSDYGFWLSEFFPEEFDGLQVSDLSEIPKTYFGEVLLIGDHGNMTLFVRKRNGHLKEIWSVV